MRWFKALGGILLIALLAGCIKVEGNIVINDDGSGSVDFLTAVDSEGVLSILGDFDEIPAEELGGPDEICNQFSSDLNADPADFPPDAEITDYEEDGFCGARVTFDLAASTDHSAALVGLFEDEQVRLLKSGDNWIFEANVDTSDITSETDEIPAGLADALFGDASVKFIVDLPGRAIDGQNNATSQGDNGRFEWDIDFADPPSRMFAQTEPGSDGGGGGLGGLGLILIILAVLALLAAAAWWFFTRRNKSGDPGPASNAAYTAPMSGSTPPVANDPIKPAQPAGSAAQATVAVGGNDVHSAAAIGGATAASPATDPVFDEALNAWVIDDPTRGRLVHDTATDTWKPA